MKETTPRASYALNLSQPDFWNKPDPTMDATWSALAAKPLQARVSAADYWLLDGPPYANGEAHLGHLLNKYLKDAFARRQLALGKNPTWRAGWDCHGLPLELATQKRPDAPPRKSPEFLTACRQEATHWMGRQAVSFGRLGTTANLKDPWSTMDPRRESKAMELLGDLWRAGLLVERCSPTHWCPACQSALAASELEKGTAPKSSLFAWTPLTRESSARLMQSLDGHGRPVQTTQEVGLAYWTTTPWTLPANRAFAYPEKGEFLLCKLSRGALCLMEKSSVARLAEKLGPMETMGAWNSEDLDAMELGVQTPLGGRAVPARSAPFASAEDGTGFVHVAPAFGPEDYEWAESRLDLGLDLGCPMGPDGRYLLSEGMFSGLAQEDAGALASSMLREAGHTMLQETASGDSQLCWRHGAPVFYRASRQWALDLDKAVPGDELKRGLRQRALDSMASMSFLPSDKPKNALRNMLAGRRFWTLSRDRSWGLPLPLLRNAQGDLSSESSAWWEKAQAAVAVGGVEAYAAMQPPPGLAKESQCVDVWFDSGAAFETAGEPGFDRPDLVVEGADQTRGWFLSSMLLNAFRSDGPAFKEVLCHGFVVDEKGQKLAKSKGNAPDTAKLLDEHGADALRTWALSQTAGQEVVWSKAALESAKGELRDWRNFLRFLLAHQDRGPLTNHDPAPATSLDHLALRLHAKAVRGWRAGFERGEPHHALASLADFRRFASSNLFELAKRDLYCAPLAADGPMHRRRMLSWLLNQWLPLLDPFMPLAVAQARSLMAHEAKSFFQEAAFDSARADEAEKALAWRDQTHARLDRERASLSNPKAKFVVLDQFSSFAEQALGVPKEHLVRGAAFMSENAHGEPLWTARSPWECHRCRGLFSFAPDPNRGGGGWDVERFGHAICDVCRQDESEVGQ